MNKLIQPKPGEFWHDLNGNIFQVVNITKHFETKKLVIVYADDNDKCNLFTSPLDSFLQFFSKVDNDE